MGDETKEAELLKVLLADRDLPCPVCSYNLRNCAGPACPECGARLDLRVGSIDLRLGAWLAAVLVLAIPMGFTGILAVIAVIASRRATVWRLEDWAILAGLWGLTFLLAAGLWLLNRWRGRLLRRAPKAQWALVALLATVMVVVQLAVVYLLSRFA